MYPSQIIVLKTTILVELQKQYMGKVLFFSIILSCIAFTGLSGQSIVDSIPEEDKAKEIKGIVLDIVKQTALPYANIYVLNKNIGAITNEKGHFTLNLADLDESDTIRFQYIGYKTKVLTVGQLDASTVVYLKEEIINLSELIVFGDVPDLKTIVKNVLVYKDSNYRKTTSKRQTFLRDREIADLSEFKLHYKKSTIEELDRDMIKKIEDKTPDYATSYTDFLGYYYSNQNEDDSIRRKLDPIRMVSLKEEYLEDLKQLETLFEGILAETKEDEYWKVRSGVFGTKLDLEEDTVHADTESITDSRRKTSSYAGYIKYLLGYSLLDDKDQWEFLHKISKYKYTLAGGTRVNGEDVYVIDFEPNSSGLFVGRMYISIGTYALIRADYEYAPEKTGRDIHLLGIGYTENQFSGSIYFEKKDENYLLKYFSYRFGYKASVDRKIALLKKKKQWLFDKKMKELKIGLELKVDVEESVELLVIEEKEIPQHQFTGFNQPEYIDIIYVDQFDENLWKGFSIIEPTEQMKEYKKQQVSYSQ